MKDRAKNFLELVQIALSAIQELDVNQVKNKLDNNENFLLIDVREESEWAQSRISGSIYLGKGIIERDIESIEPNKNREIVLYCQGGYRSALAAESLQRMGYTNAISMRGGFGEWVNIFPEFQRENK